jgi:hypothetical protein
MVLSASPEVVVILADGTRVRCDKDIADLLRGLVTLE